MSNKNKVVIKADEGNGIKQPAENMLTNEFTARTGYTPTAEEWETITANYNEFPGDKDAFCAAWCKLYPTKAGQIDRERKEAERRERETERVINWVSRFVRRHDGQAIDREAFEVIAAKFNRLTFKFNVFKLKDWHGITAGWSCEMWRNYWALHSACAYFG